MKKSRQLGHRIVAIVLAALIVLSVIITAVATLTAKGVTQSEINTLKKQQEELKNQKNATLSKINSLEYKQASLIAQKEALDQKLLLTQSEIDNIVEQIQLYEQLIAQAENDVQIAVNKETDQLELYKARMRTMEENGVVSYMSVVFESNSFTDLLANLDFIKDIMRSDVKAYEDFVAARVAVEEAKKVLEDTKAECEAEKEELNLKYVELEADKAEAESKIDEINADIEEERKAYAAKLAESNALQAQINKAAAQLRREQAAKQERNESVAKGTGVLVWPSNTKTVTSQFGMRFHPILKENRLHGGIDIGAPYGSNIFAADTGTVIISAYSSSWGNYVVVDHGNGMTTLYAHMSSRGVSAGKEVSRGAVIGKVGSTGLSTGPHLHFEVSVNGVRKNPLNYL
ncbi:MAG: peptidoglycan DD-metalloendopeptidase family protein [Oscillospiraceae bacterium]|jgi:murein DD-endopeptidase MepM/ murein hydrolase activator NlpD|nr:peptidoglycan DD-metalloendopeptidase family protein [Oscillospiraceae bacterium]